MYQSTQPTPPSAVLYLRVSTAKQEEDGTSLDTQEAACRAYCAEHGLTVAAVFREVFTGAELYARQDLAAARQMIRDGAATVLLCHSVDRLSRRQAHIAILADEIERAGARLAFVTEDFERSAVGEFIRSAKAFAAEVEREKITERSERGRRARIDRGSLPAGCRPLYGYRWRDEVDAAGKVVRRKARLEIDDITGPIAARIFRDALAGRSLRSIAFALTAEGIPTPMGKERWSSSTLNWILTNPMYAGTAGAYRYRVEKLPSGKRQVHRQPVADQIAMPAGTVPPLVSAADFETVQARLTANKRQSSRNNPNPEAALLRAGFARCGYCGHSASVQNGRRGGPAYKCSGWARDEHACPCFSMQTATLDAAVWARVEDILIRPETVAQQVDLLRERDPVAADLTTIDRRLAALAREQHRAAVAVATIDDADAAAPLLVQLKALAAEKRRLTEDRTHLEAQRAGWQAAQDRLSDLTVWCRRVAGNLPRLTYAEKRDLLTALDVRVMVYRTDHSPRWEISMGLDGIVSRTASSSNATSNGCGRLPCRGRACPGHVRERVAGQGNSYPYRLSDPARHYISSG